MKINAKKISFGLIGITILSFISYFVYQNMLIISTDDAQIEGHTMMIAPKINGFVKKVNVVQGQKVNKGDVLAEIDKREFENTLKEKKSDLVSLEARYKDAQLNYQRSEKLFKDGATSRQQYDTNYSNYRDIKSQLDKANALISQAELNLEFTQIKAPDDGFIAKKALEIGQYASVGVPLIGFVDSHERWVIANFKETEIEDIKPGQKAEVTVDAISKKIFMGKVFALNSATGSAFTLLPPDNSTGNFTKIVQRVPVRIEFENLTSRDIELLKSGLSVIVKIKKN